MKKTFVIGDIHGSYEKLINVISKANINFDEDRVIFLGDYIDRGTKNKKVIDYVFSLKGDIIRLKGNHELMFIDFYNQKKVDLYISNGGIQTLNEYAVGKNPYDFYYGYVKPSDIEGLKELKELIIKNTKIYYEDENYFYIHGGLFPNMSIEDNLKIYNIEDLLWIREEFIRSNYNWGKKIVFGHTIKNKPLFMHNKIGIDTGAFLNKGKLTILELPSEKIYQSED